MKIIYSAYSVLSLFIAASAFAGTTTGTFTLNSMSINGKPVGPASLVLSGDGAAALYNSMTQLTEYPDSNGQETERAGDGIVCHKQNANGQALCIIDFTDLSKGVLEHN